jgi:hypothetical protein
LNALVAYLVSKALTDGETNSTSHQKTKGRYRDAALSANYSDFTSKVKSWACVPDTRLSISKRAKGGEKE